MTTFKLNDIRVKGDVSLFLAIEKLVQEKMVIYQGMSVAKDTDLAEILEMNVDELREEVRKNMDRFPSDFMAEISDGEYLLAEQEIIMLGGLLSSERAIKVHLQFIEYFVQLAHENGLSIFDLIDNRK